MNLKAILENIEVASSKNIPMCQDTGTPLVYVEVGGNAEIDLNTLYIRISEGIVRATDEVPLRKHLVDPVSRKNVTENLSDYTQFIHISILPDADYTTITVLPKGGGSENMSALRMLKPSEGVEGFTKFVLEVVTGAGGKPCPPVIVGIGVGGTADISMKLSKKAILRKVGEGNSDDELASLEEELLEKINSLGIGPMALGGKTTALSVNIESAPCNTNGLPVAVNLQCWAARRASAKITNGGVEYL